MEKISDLIHFMPYVEGNEGQLIINDGPERPAGLDTFQKHFRPDSIDGMADVILTPEMMNGTALYGMGADSLK